MSIYTKAKSMKLTEMNTLLNTILPYITTDLKKNEIIYLLIDMPKYTKNEVESNRIPCDNTYSDLHVNGMSVLSVDFDKNIEYLHNEIYDR